MNVAFEQIAENTAIPFEITMLMLIILGGIIFYAKDVRLGILMHMLGCAGLFIWFYEAGLDYTYPLIAFFIFFICLCFTLIAVNKAVSAGQVV